MKNNLKNVFLFSLFFFSFVFFPRPAKAEIWGESLYGAMFLKEGLEELFKKSQDTVIASLKMNAIRTIQSRMMSTIGGGGNGQPQIVTNWRETIYGTADKEATAVVRDYFSRTKSGAGGTGGQKIVAAGEGMYNADPTSVKPTIDKYVKGGDVSKIFDKRYTPNPTQALVDLAKMRNNPAYYAMTAQGIYAVNYGEKAGAESAKDIAYGGFKGKDASKSNPNDKSGAAKDEKISMPGSATRDTFTKVMNMPTDMVSLARSIPEVAAAMVTQMLTQMIGQGFSMANQQMNKAQSTIMSQTGGSIPQIQKLIKAGIK